MHNYNVLAIQKHEFSSWLIEYLGNLQCENSEQLEHSGINA